MTYNKRVHSNNNIYLYHFILHLMYLYTYDAWNFNARPSVLYASGQKKL